MKKNKLSLIFLLAIFISIFGVKDAIRAEDDQVPSFDINNRLLVSPPTSSPPSGFFDDDYKITIAHNGKVVDKKDSLRLRIYDSNDENDEDYIFEKDYKKDAQDGKKIFSVNLQEYFTMPFTGTTYIRIVDLTKRLKTYKLKGPHIHTFYSMSEIGPYSYCVSLRSEIEFCINLIVKINEEGESKTSNSESQIYDPGDDTRHPDPDDLTWYIGQLNIPENATITSVDPNFSLREPERNKNEV